MCLMNAFNMLPQGRILLSLPPRAIATWCYRRQRHLIFLCLSFSLAVYNPRIPVTLSFFFTRVRPSLHHQCTECTSVVPTKIFLQQTDRSGKKVRCMFLANVAVGRAFKTFEGKLDPNANLCPPPGFDSVIGEVSEKRQVALPSFPKQHPNKEE